MHPVGRVVNFLLEWICSPHVFGRVNCKEAKKTLPAQDPLWDFVSHALLVLNSGGSEITADRNVGE